MSMTNVRSPNRVLSERIQFVARAIVVVFSAGWIGWFYPYDDLLDRSGTPLGADFSMFYVAGQVVWDGAGDQLYDQAEHQRRLRQLFPAIDSSFALPYRYPPWVAVLIAPLATLPYALAYGVFLALSCAAWWTAAYQLVAATPELRDAWRKSLRWAILGWPVALETLVGGQASMFALLIAVVVYVLLRNQRLVLAGAILALAAYKPNVLALLALGCLIRYPRMLTGFLPAAAGVGLLCLVPDGWAGLLRYHELAASLATQAWDVATPPWKVHGLAPWFQFMLGDDGRLACGLIGVAATFLVAWQSRNMAVPLRDTDPSRGATRPQNGIAKTMPGAIADATLRAGIVTPGGSIEPIWFATLISLNALFNAYTPIYDLVLLFIGAALTAEQLIRWHGPNVGRTLAGAQVLLAIVYFGPHLSQAIAQSTGAQPFGLVLAALAVWQAGLLWQSQRAPATHSHQLLTSASGR